jgi:hypothetical protein
MTDMKDALSLLIVPPQVSSEERVQEKVDEFFGHHHVMQPNEYLVRGEDGKIHLAIECVHTDSEEQSKYWQEIKPLLGTDDVVVMSCDVVETNPDHASRHWREVTIKVLDKREKEKTND